MSSTAAAASGSYSRGALIPYTQTFIQTSAGNPVTTEIALVGQILDNGQTNWVGYDNGNAEYLLTSSANNAEQTTLADGMTYYVSSGDAPAGYLATGGAGSGSGSGSGSGMGASATMTGSMSASGSGSNMMTTSMPSSSGSDSDSDSSSMTSSGSGSSSSTTTPNSSSQLSTGGVIGAVMGIMAVFMMNMMA